MRDVFVRNGFNYDLDAVSLETGLDCGVDELTGEILTSLTQQQFKEDADINVIVKRFGLTGELPDDVRMPQSGDFTGIPDFHTALNLVRATQEEFMRVPAEIRGRFQNDPPG